MGTTPYLGHAGRETELKVDIKGSSVVVTRRHRRRRRIRGGMEVAGEHGYKRPERSGSHLVRARQVVGPAVRWVPRSLNIVWVSVEVDKLRGSRSVYIIQTITICTAFKGHVA
jgi:hypothetical protein